MGTQFYHGFKTGLGPFVPRDTPGRTFPTGLDCAKVRDGKLVLSIKANPLRTGHLWVPPDEFQVVEGYVEARMKFRGPPGAHGSVWLQALQPYATEDDHEIDVVENFGSLKVAHQGIWTQADTDPEPEQVHHSAWRGNTREWQVYGCAMTSDGYVFTVNGVEISASVAYTATKPKYLVASMLISDWEYTRYGQGNTWEQKAWVDWIRVSDV